jgi:hypothetical protein
MARLQRHWANAVVPRLSPSIAELQLCANGLATLVNTRQSASSDGRRMKHVELACPAVHNALAEHCMLIE